MLFRVRPRAGYVCGGWRPTRVYLARTFAHGDVRIHLRAAVKANTYRRPAFQWFYKVCALDAMRHVSRTRRVRPPTLVSLGHNSTREPGDVDTTSRRCSRNHNRKNR